MALATKTIAVKSGPLPRNTVAKNPSSLLPFGLLLHLFQY
jgi:hypothetical protein